MPAHLQGMESVLQMESTGEPMKIHVTDTTFRQTQNQFTYSEGIEVEVKGKGLMKTYFL